MATLPKLTASIHESERLSGKTIRQVSASQAKTHLLELLKDIDHKRESLVITKRGRPIARLTPIESQPSRSIFGCMKGTGRILGDVIGPEPDVWEAAAE